MRRLWLSLALAAAVVTLVGTVTAAAVSSGTGPRYPGGPVMGVPGAGGGMMNGAPGMMGGIWLAGDGTHITSIAAARGHAAIAATSLGLHPGEVIWFDNGFYAELKDATGASATEVLVDPVSGAVSTEPGPAMMWNTRYGMYRPAPQVGTTVSAEQATRLADAWLAANRPGRRAEAADAYPGYYTLEFTRGGTVDGMLSINASTGQVWYRRAYP
jgi:hypothetical protein